MAKNDAEEIVSLIFTAGRLLRDQAAGHEHKCPLTMAQVKVLSMVATGASPTMKEVAESLLITSPSATAAISHLEKSGYLARQPDKGDRRIVRLKITEKGKKAFEKHRRILIGKIGEVIGKLDSGERAAFAGIFQKIINAYKK